MQIAQSYLDDVRRRPIVDPGEDSGAAAADLRGCDGEAARDGGRQIPTSDEGEGAKIVAAEI